MHRFNVVFRKYILAWALIAMVVGYLAGRFNQGRVASLAFLLTPLAFLMMFIMVFPSTMSSLSRLRVYAVPMIASFSLLLFSPLIAYVVSAIVPESFHHLRTGIIISSTVPPSAMLAAWTAFLEGDVLLAFIIQSFSSVAALVSMPFGVRMLFPVRTPYSVPLLLRNLFFLVVIPFLLGAILRKAFKRYFTEELMGRIKPTLSSLSGIIELFVILISVGLRAEVIRDFPVIILWGVLSAALYHVTTFIIALYFVKVFRFGYETAVPLVYQNGTKNLSVAMAIAITSFGGEGILGVAACVLTQFPVSALFYSLLARNRWILMNHEERLKATKAREIAP